MASYKVTGIVKSLINHGLSETEIKNTFGAYKCSDGWYVNGRQQEAAIEAHDNMLDTRAIAAAKPAPARRETPADTAYRIGRSYGVNGQIWDNA